MRKFEGQVLLSPSDLVTHLGCQHATALDLLAMEGGLAVPTAIDPAAGFLQQKGLDFERNFADRLGRSGRQGVSIPENVSLFQRVELTAAAMRSGADFIYQGALLRRYWHGFADFLMRVDDVPSALGNWSYEATDAKLASHVAPRHVVQVTVYSGLLAHFQGIRPRRMTVVLGNGAAETFRPSDFAHYVRMAGFRLRQFLADGSVRQTMPEPCAHCQICRWKPRCTAEWDTSDHLSQVAFIRRSQRDKLCAAAITTTAALAALPADAQVPGMVPETLARLRAQAKLQVAVRGAADHRFELLPRVPGRGFTRLPQPDPSDLFLDLEGDPLFAGGLEYLFGLRVGSGEECQYRSWWGHDREQERHAVEGVLDFVAGHLARHPDGFIYHYGNYEVAALRRLVMRHGTREGVVDDLLRGQKFVDLYAVVREAVQISEPHYSLKDLEKLYQADRVDGVATAMESVIAYEAWRSGGNDRLLWEIETYNAADCRSASAARDWLLSIRPAETEWFTPEASPVADDALERRSHAEQELAEITAALMAGASEAELPFRTLVADMLEFHRREQKVEWWALFDRQTRSEEELVDDP